MFECNKNKNFFYKRLIELSSKIIIVVNIYFMEFYLVNVEEYLYYSRFFNILCWDYIFIYYVIV